MRLVSALSAALLLLATTPVAGQGPERPRARDLGVPFNGVTGRWNAITDVAGIRVGHATVISDDTGPHAARTGVTALIHDGMNDGLWAAVHRHNGDGEMTGALYIAELGELITPILITNTISVGTVHEASIRWSLEHPDIMHPLALPVVAETWDGGLNDIWGFHVRPEHVFAALDGAATGPVAEGNVGGGTGMRTHSFKAGIGTASRVLPAESGGYTIGVLVQSNYGDREDLRIAGVPVGREIPDLMPEIHAAPESGSQAAAGPAPGSGRDGSIIVVLATDAPLLPHQLQRALARVPMGLARTGSYSSSGSGDIFVAFSTAEHPATGVAGTTPFLPDRLINDVFKAVIQATEEAVINALVAGETMTGRNGTTIYGLPHDRLREILRRYGRLNDGG